MLTYSPRKDFHMPIADNANRGVQPARRPATRRRTGGRLLAAGTLVAMGLAVTACGSSEKTTILNTEKVERAIEKSSMNQRDKKVNVSCPSGVHQKKKLEFSCTAFGKGGSTKFVVTTLDDSGRVHYEAK